MPAAPIIAAGAAVIGTTAAVVGTANSIKASKQQSKYNNQVLGIQRQQADMQSMLQKRDAIRAARLSAGQISQASENQGVGGSSASLGGLGSIQSQLNGSLSFLDQYNRLSDQGSVLAGKANKAGVEAQIFSSVASLGITVASNSDRIGAVFK